MLTPLRSCISWVAKDAPILSESLFRAAEEFAGFHPVKLVNIGPVRSGGSRPPITMVF